MTTDRKPRRPTSSSPAGPRRPAAATGTRRGGVPSGSSAAHDYDPPSQPVNDVNDPNWQGDTFTATFIDTTRPDPDGDEDAVAIAEPPDQRAPPHTPLVALVGRPNVGKSRCFNRMTGTRFAIVEDMPGVTRDRQYGDGTWDGHAIQVVDTGGFEPESEDVLLKQMRQQAQLAIREADRIVFVVDGVSGLLPADREIAALLRTSRKPVFVAVNKIDGPRQEATIGEFWELGFEHVFGVSAEHGRNWDELMDAVVEGAPRTDELVPDDTLVKVAVLGRPNAGKSTMVNRLLGEDRLLTSDVPGTTRDSINTWLVHNGQRYLFIDTAGIRRKRSIDETVEKYAVVQSFKAIDRSDVVLYLIDATVGVTAQDQRVIGLIVEKGRALIIGLNKWDAVAKDHKTADQQIAKLREELRHAAFAPVVTLSARSGQRVHRIFGMIQAAHAQYIRRISTSQINETVREALQRNPPKSWGNQRLKVYYASQVATRPPTFMFSVNNPDLVHFSYRRYLVNMVRSTFAFEGTPVKVFFRGRKKGEEGEEMT